MPVEPRHTHRNLASDLRAELKHRRGEISCAECRRLGSKCDRKRPCDSCVRRGCATLCLDGPLTADKRARLGLIDTEQLYHKIAEMSERIRQLEDALAVFQAGVSSERHPLLRDELLTIKLGPEVRQTVDEQDNVLSQTIDAFGTLTIGENGETKYIGRSGSAEALFLAGPCGGEPDTLCPIQDSEPDVPRLGNELESLTLAFPFSVFVGDKNASIYKLESHLPPQPRAWALCEAYLEHFSWWFRPLKRDELINDVLTPIYKKLSDRSEGGYQHNVKPDASSSTCSPHRLAVLFMILAVGALVDLTLPSYSIEAEKYYELARAALGLETIFDSPRLETVQAVALMASYHSQWGSKYTLESAWSLVSLASKLGQAIGLHRDSSAWHMDDKIVQRRRNLFWEIFILEMMHSVALGRPPSVSLNHVDCQLPTDDESSVTENADTLHEYWRWRLSFSRDVYYPVMNTLLAAKAPSYGIILDLDKKIRQTPLPSVKLYVQPEEHDYGNPSMCMKGWLMSQYQSFTMLYIHRTFFAQVLLDHPDNPLDSPYAPSFVMATKCASVLLRSFLHHYKRCPDLCGRFWGIWTHVFTAAIILGATVHRCPGIDLAGGALTELNLVLEPFAKGALHSKRARHAYGILSDLKSKAEKSYQHHRIRRENPVFDVALHTGPEAELSAARIAIFAGQTRVMTPNAGCDRRATMQPDANANGRAANGQSPFTEVAAVPQDLSADTFADVHPSLIGYLSSYPDVSFFSGTALSGTHEIPIGSTSVNSQEQRPSLSPFAEDLASPSNLSPYPPIDFSLPSFSNDDSLMDLHDFGFNEDDMMTDYWTVLMRETGILDSSEGSASLQTPLSDNSADFMG